MDALEHIIRATWKCQLLLLITTRALFKQKKLEIQFNKAYNRCQKIILIWHISPL